MQFTPGFWLKSKEMTFLTCQIWSLYHVEYLKNGRLNFYGILLPPNPELWVLPLLTWHPKISIHFCEKGAQSV